MFIFKLLVLQFLFGLFDEQTQYQILDHLSFHDFLDITGADTVPDQNTIHEFCEKLTRAQLHDERFATYAGHVEKKIYHPQRQHRGCFIRRSSTPAQPPSGERKHQKQRASR